MTDYKTLSDSELTEALNFHRRQRNMSRGINEAAHARQTQLVRLLEAEEARRLEEAKTEHPVKTEYKALMKHPIEHIKGLYKAGHKVSDTSGVSKSNLVTDYLRSKHGDAKVDQAFGLKEALEEASKPNQYIEVTNKFTGSKSYHEVHPSKAFAALNHHNSLWNTKSARIVSGKEAEAVKTSKMKKEEVGLDEAVQVNKKNYSWGKMITVRHGSSHSFPLHPEHQEKIKNLKDGESTAFKDETGSHVTASREGDKVHLKLRGVNQKTTVAHSHFTESIDYSKEKPNKYVIYKHKDKYGVSQDTGTGYNWDHSYHHGYHDTVDAAKAWAAKHAGKYPHKIEVKEEVELDETSLNDLVWSKNVTKPGSSKQVIKKYNPGDKVKYAGGTSVVVKHDDKGFVTLSNPNWSKNRVVPHTSINEEAEQIDELSKKTLSSYIKNAVDNKAVQDRYAGRTGDRESYSLSDKRDQGIKRAVDKLTREEVEQIDEISKDTLHSYLKKASKNVDSLSNQRDKVQKDMSKTYSAIAKRSGTENAAHNAITQSQHNKATATYRSAAKAANKVLGGHSDLVKRHTDLTKKINKRMDGMDRAYDKMHAEEVELEENFKEGDKVSFTTDYGTKQKGVITNPHTRTVKGKRHAEVRVGLGPNTWSRVHVPHHRLEKVSEEVEINEAADLRVTKIYNKWPKKATYAVHNANRSYFKEFDSEEAARAHHKEKSSMKEEVFTEAKLERNKSTVGAHHLERDSGDHKMYTAYTGSLVRRLHTVTDKDDNILGQGSTAASAMAKAKLKKPHRDALMHDDNQIVKVHDTRGAHNVGTQVATPGKGKWFKDHEEAMKYAKTLPGKIRHADPKTGHVD